MEKSNISEPQVTGYNVEQKGEDEIETVYDASKDNFRYFDESDNPVTVTGPLTIELARLYISLDGYRIQNEETTSEGTLFYTNYYPGGLNETDYPQIWFWLTTDGSLKVVYRPYNVTPVLGDYVDGEKQYHSFNHVGVITLHFNDFDVPYEAKRGDYITQTLFNDDEKFEYIRPLYTDGLSNITTGSTTHYDYELGISFTVPYIEKTYGNGITGFQVVQEDGTVIQTVNFDGGFLANFSSGLLYRINGKLYLIFEGYVLDTSSNSRRSAVLIYELERGTNKIRKVMDHVGGIVVTPHVADRSDQITVELTDEGGIREIQVVNAQGQIEMRVPVQEGQKRVTIPASQLSRGMNVVNAIGDKRQAQKVMVK